MGSIKQGWNGRFFEDFHVGDIYCSRLGRTITETDNIQFTMITNNTNQIHFNAHYASLTEFKKPLVNSALTLSVVAGLGVSDLSDGTSSAMTTSWEPRGGDDAHTRRPSVPCCCGRAAGLDSRAMTASAKRSAAPATRSRPRPGSLTSTSISMKRPARATPSTRA